MYIKSIVLDGFKSYGQRTEVTGFDPLFNAITGLNGTGKSNILDSICFVLGISNLTHVRANSMQDLIYKSGQGGINKAVVSIVFDNTNPAQSPSGFENVEEITVTRQIALGGKNKYLINGVNVTGKKIQDLFCSIQLNVNNPHFLIMQGRITKVLNMKPPEILSMVDEAAGTRMYQVKKQDTQKLIEKKDAKLSEFQAVINEELTPKLKKLREEREQFLEYQRTKRDLTHLMGLFRAWQYFEAKRNFIRCDEALKEGQQKISVLEEKIDANKATVTEIDAEVELITANKESEASKELQEVEAKLKEKEKEEAKILASAKSIQDNISTENKKFNQLKRTLSNDLKALAAKETELNKVQSLFESLKENERVDSEALDLAQKKYEALCAGMELNDDGETETLAGQLMNAKEEAARANTESKQAAMQLTLCENQLKAKSKNATGSSADYQKDETNLKKYEQEVSQLENSIKQLKFSENEMSELNNRYRVLNQESRVIRDEIEEFESRRSYTSFRYRNPEPNFNRASVKGVVCKLFSMKDDIYASALETAASGKLYNVVVDTDATSKKLLERGDLQTRTTFIPLNKISGQKIKDNIVKYAQDLVGKENCQPALSLINYDRSVEAAMEYVFGDVFICKNIDIAKRVTFDQRILKRCVTLDGDSTDPRGILSGGATQRGESILKLLKRVQQLESELNPKEEELKRIVAKLEQLSGVQEKYNALKHKLEVTKHELQLIQDRLRNTSFARLQDEVDGLKTQIVELKAKIAKCEEHEKKFIAKVKDLESKLQDSTGYKERRLKEAEREMEQAKKKAEKSGKEWRQREQDYANLTLEITELKKELEEVKEQLKITEENIKKMEGEYQQATDGSNEIKEAVKELQVKAKQMKEAIAQKNKEVQSKLKRKDQLLAQNTEFELEIKKFSHQINDLTAACKASKHREQEYSKKIDKNNAYMKQGEELSSKEGQDLERKIKVAQEKTHKLERVINTQAQAMFEVEEKKFQEIVRKQEIVKIDREKLVAMISELDEKKEHALKLAMDQVSKDFGSIFATLLPGANAKLVPMQGAKILQGLEIKVSLDNVWKESLTELSGGQRSLAALSLILAMLLFKPAPLYILDEVDAALDLSHTQNIGRMLRSHFQKSQFIVVSLKDGMFNNANVLFRTRFIDGVSAIQRTENSRH